LKHLDRDATHFLDVSEKTIEPWNQGAEVAPR
jgi:hypothetical protein